MRILPDVKEIWSGHKFKGKSNDLTLTLTLSLRSLVMDVAHRLNEINIRRKFNETLSNDSGDS